ncbi:hypothetical protein BGX31_009892 [Mortierella sp. GBA43]|nr:hypothetical protein BGX31_009892 [Mortierella sp. GBA43]
MSTDSETSTLPLSDDINELPVDDQDSVVKVPVNLVSLVPLFKDIPLTGSKTIIGRNSIERTEDTVKLGCTISREHCEISSRSMTDAGAAIWIKDTSTNGVWVNDKKIAKDEPIKIFNKSIISFAPSSARNTGAIPTFMLLDERSNSASGEQKEAPPKRGNEDLSAKESEPEAKKPKIDEESAFEKEFNCGICYDIMDKAVLLQPCLHSFCRGCCKIWLQNSNECPSCRVKVTKTKRDFRLNSLIAVFLENRPHLKRDDIEDDGAQSDTSDLVAGRRNNGYDYSDDEDEDEDEDDDEDDDDDDNGAQPLPWPPGFVGLPATCPCCEPTNTLGYVCPDGVLPDSVADQFRCKMCQIATCGCSAYSLDDMISRPFPFTGYVNHAEEIIIDDYVRANNISRGTVWQAVKDGMENGQYTYLGTDGSPAAQGQDINSTHKLCLDCGRKFYMNGPLYKWRTELDPASLPAAVTSKEDCWWGRECRTQFSNTHRAHAERLNHMCEKRRRS